MSSEYQVVCLDELTTFEEYQYTYMLSRVRSAKGLPVRIRAATNPGGIGHEWVMRRWMCRAANNRINNPLQKIINRKEKLAAIWSAKI